MTDPTPVRWPDINARTIDEIDCVVVLLAIAFAHLLDAGSVSWAAFSGYMVMRGHVSETFLRGFLRIVGTSAGLFSALPKLADSGGDPGNPV